MTDNTRKGIKPKIVRLAHQLGVFNLQRILQRKNINILMYHRFSEKTEPFKLDGFSFEKQIRFLRQKFNLIPLSALVKAAKGNMELPPNSVIITIDDGYADNYVVAFPILKKYKVQATIFLATDFVDQHSWLWPMKLLFILQNTKGKHFKLRFRDTHDQSFSVETFKDWHVTQLAIFHYLRKLDNQLKDEFLGDLAKQLNVDVPEQTCGDFLPLSWNQIREMRNEGIEFGSHTCTHPILSRQNETALKYETVESKRLIENRLQQPIFSFCYPNGQFEDFNPDVIKAVQGAGYGCAVTTVSGINTMRRIRPFELKRKGFMLTDGHEMYRWLLRN